MQQLKIEHKNTKKDRREGKGRVLAVSRNVFRLQNTSDAYYVESESGDDVYYFVKFKPDVFKWYCSCKDNSTRHLKCKHLFAIEFAIKWGTLKDIEKLPSIKTAKPDVEKEGDTIQVTPSSISKSSSSYRDDEYTF